MYYCIYFFIHLTSAGDACFHWIHDTLCLVLGHTMLQLLPNVANNFYLNFSVFISFLDKRTLFLPLLVNIFAWEAHFSIPLQLYTTFFVMFSIFLCSLIWTCQVYQNSMTSSFTIHLLSIHVHVSTHKLALNYVTKMSLL